MSAQAKAMDDLHVAYWAAHITSPFALLAAVIGLFPVVLAAITTVVVFIFYIIQIYESKVVQRWLHTRRQRKIAHYTARILELEAQLKIQDADKD